MEISISRRLRHRRGPFLCLVGTPETVLPIKPCSVVENASSGRFRSRRRQGYHHRHRPAPNRRTSNATCPVRSAVRSFRPRTEDNESSQSRFCFNSLDQFLQLNV